MKAKIIILLSIFIILNSCDKNNQTNNTQGSTSPSFNIIQEYEQEYSAKNVKKIANLNVENAVYIYVQHLKEQLEWNKRITYMINKMKFKKTQQNANRVNNSVSQNSQSSYDDVNSNEIFTKYKKKYEKIFFDKIGVPRSRWEKFSSLNYKQMHKYQQKHPQIVEKINRFGRLLQEQQMENQ